MKRRVVGIWGPGLFIWVPKNMGHPRFPVGFPSWCESYGVSAQRVWSRVPEGFKVGNTTWADLFTHCFWESDVIWAVLYPSA